VNPVEHGPLIDVARLTQLLEGRPQEQSGRRARRGPKPVTLLDVRWSLIGPPGRDLYLAGHIPGARFVDLDHQLAAPHAPGTGRHPMPAAEDFQAAMRGLGVSDDRTVVVYDAADSTAAARAWWLLRYFSHHDVFVLDGGYAAWIAAGLPIAAGDEPWGGGDVLYAGAADGPGDFIAVPGAMPLLAADDAAKLATDGVLLDARAATRSPGTSQARSAHRPATTWGRTTASWRRRSCAPGSPRWASAARTGARSAFTAAPESPPRTRYWPWNWPASRRGSTPARGPSGSPTRRGPSLPATEP
jgi:3-mercaptopyruvate sulfurtransferase SseA